jgi:hypothetical protein
MTNYRRDSAALLSFARDNSFSLTHFLEVAITGQLTRRPVHPAGTAHGLLSRNAPLGTSTTRIIHPKLASKLKLRAGGRIVLAVRETRASPNRTGFDPPRKIAAVLLDFWLFYLKENVTDGEQTGTEHTRLIPQHREER